jgi:hypothetical protein
MILLSSQMSRVADMWGAAACLRKCFTALAQLNGGYQELQELIAILLWLPDSVQALASYANWEAQWQGSIVEWFNDVHALFTSHDQLQHFRQLPFAAVKAWASSDKLIIDSENDVAAAISWWYGGNQGSRASEEQLKELSGLLRVANLSPGKSNSA